jgi:hypothetical protein
MIFDLHKGFELLFDEKFEIFDNIRLADVADIINVGFDLLDEFDRLDIVVITFYQRSGTGIYHAAEHGEVQQYLAPRFDIDRSGDRGKEFRQIEFTADSFELAR